MAWLKNSFGAAAMVLTVDCFFWHIAVFEEIALHVLNGWLCWIPLLPYLSHVYVVPMRVDEPEKI